MGAISFEDYHLSEISYVINDNFDDSSETIDINPTIEIGVDRDREERKIFSKLRVIHGSLENSKSAFVITVDITGQFYYDESEIDSYNVEFDNFISESTIAILWSFIRPMISDLITRGNQFPNFLLPVINVKQLIEENKLVIRDINEEMPPAK